MGMLTITESTEMKINIEFDSNNLYAKTELYNKVILSYKENASQIANGR